MKPSSDRAGEIVSLSERMVYLQALRVGFAAASLGASLFAPQVVGAEIADLLLATAAYIAVAAGVELLRQMSKARSLLLVGGMLLADGVYLAWTMYATGGTQSPLRFLVFIHLIAVTLLASYRTGLKIALWHSLLFFVVFYAQAADLLHPTEAAEGLIPGSPEFNRVSVFNVMAFWLVALTTAGFSALNERDLRRRRKDLEDLSAMSARLKDESVPESVSQTLLDSVSTSFGFKRGVVLAYGDENLHVLAYRGPGEPPSRETGGIDALVLQAFSDQKTLLVRKLDGSPNPILDALMPFARNLVVVPMWAEGAQLGALVLEYPEGFGLRIERRVVAMVEQFAAHGALALRNSMLMQEVQTLADTDSLTGLANRRTFQKVLERELARSQRSEEPVSLLILDVDHFKKFNDTHGHQAGDEALKAVGRALAETSRDLDLAARYGGEEFAVVVPNCSVEESVLVGERLRAAVAAASSFGPITVSAGAATYPTNARDLGSLVRAADEALYESKREGRDRLTRSSRYPEDDTRTA